MVPRNRLITYWRGLRTTPVRRRYVGSAVWLLRELRLGGSYENTGTSRPVVVLIVGHVQGGMGEKRSVNEFARNTLVPARGKTHQNTKTLLHQKKNHKTDDP